MATIPDNVREAIRLLAEHTSGRFDIYGLAGPANVAVRQRIMGILAGKKTPRSASGVNAIRNALYDLLSIDGNCEAAREDFFAECARAIVAS